MLLFFYNLLPRRLLSRLSYRLARIEIKWIKNSLIFLFRLFTGASCDFAAQKDPYAYESLLAFFTRELGAGARSISNKEDAIVCPVDGKVGNCQRIAHDTLLQAKAINYSVSTLFGSAQLAADFEGATAITIYLAPDDYHRVHMPCAAKLIATRFISGERHSVALPIISKIGNVFAGNERLVLHFESAWGAMVMVMVGALNVGSISTVWQGEIKDSDANYCDYRQQDINFAKGQEIGQFNLGSTVILCIANDKLDWQHPHITTGEKILMGEILARK